MLESIIGPLLSEVISIFKKLLKNKEKKEAYFLLPEDNEKLLKFICSNDQNIKRIQIESENIFERPDDLLDECERIGISYDEKDNLFIHLVNKEGPGGETISSIIIILESSEKEVLTTSPSGNKMISGYFFIEKNFDFKQWLSFSKITKLSTKEVINNKIRNNNEQI